MKQSQTMAPRKKKSRAKMKFFLLGVCVLLLVFSMFGYKVYENNEARVNRSNAMQVTKTITTDQVLPPSIPDFFTEYRLERDKLRSERSEILRESILSILPKFVPLSLYLNLCPIRLGVSVTTG